MSKNNGMLMLMRKCGEKGRGGVLFCAIYAQEEEMPA
jgi:hypothetical protein